MLAMKEDKILKAKFLQLIASVPKPLRNEIIAVIDDDPPYSWNSAYGEIMSDTPTGKKILKKLKAIKVL